MPRNFPPGGPGDPENPFADLIPGHAGAAGAQDDNPFADLIPPRGTAVPAGDSFGAALSRAVHRNPYARYVNATAAGLVESLGRSFTGVGRLTHFPLLEETGQAITEAGKNVYAPGSGAPESIGQLVGNIAGEGVQTLAGGEGVNALTKLAAATRVGRAVPGVARLAEAIGAGQRGSYVQRVATNTLPFLPIDFALGAGAAGPGENPYAAGAKNAALGAAGAAGIEALVEAAHAFKATRGAGRSLDEAADDILRQHMAGPQAAEATTPAIRGLLPERSSAAIELPESMAAAQTREAVRQTRLATAGRLTDEQLQQQIDQRLADKLNAMPPEQLLVLEPTVVDELRRQAEREVREGVHPTRPYQDMADARVAAQTAPHPEGAEPLDVRASRALDEIIRQRQPLVPDAMPDAMPDATAAPVVPAPLEEAAARVAPAAAEAATPVQPLTAARTGRPFRTRLMRGEGASASPYNPLGAQVPVLGAGRYGTTSREYAQLFGPRLTEHEAELRNPLVIDSDQQWRALTKRAGWQYPNPFGRDPKLVEQDVARLRQTIEADGHDGVVVRIPADERYGKTLDTVFGADQVVEFHPPSRAAEAPTAAAAAGAEAATPATVHAKVTAASEAPAATEAPARYKFSTARTASGRLRNFADVETDGLVHELADIQQKLSDAAERSAYRPVVNDYGETVITATRGRTGPSRQAKALRTLDQLTAVHDRIAAELERRGVSLEGAAARLEQLHVEAAERAGMAGDVAPSALRNAPGIPFALAPLAVKGKLIGAAAAAGVGATQGDDAKRRTENAIVLGFAALGLGALGLKLARSQALRGLVNPAGLADPAVQTVLGKLAMTARNAAASPLIEKAERAYQEIFNSLYPLAQFGRKTLGTNRVLAEAQRASGWEEAAEITLRTEYAPAAKAARGIEPQVAALLTADRALELARHGLPNKGVDLVAAAAAKRTLEAIPEVQRAADLVRDYYKQLLYRRFEAGLMSAQDYARIAASGESYVPFVRDFIAEVRDSASRGSRGLAQRGKAVRAMTDEEAVSQIKNPLEQAVADTYLVERAVARQRVTTLMAEAYDKAPQVAQDFLIERAHDYRAKHGRMLSITVRGKERNFEVLDQDLYDAWAGLSQPAMDYAGRFLNIFKRVERAGITMTPRFTVFNAVRDAAFTLLQQPGAVRHAVVGGALGAGVGAASDPEHPLRGALIGGAIGQSAGLAAPHVARILAAVADVIHHGTGLGPGDGAKYVEFLREGGSGFGYFPRSQQEASKFFRELQDQGEVEKIIHPKSWWDGLAMLNRAIETAPRLARYKAMRAAGMDVPEAILEGRDTSVDFSVLGSGRTVQTASSATAFFNAKLQGWDKLVRLLGGDRLPTGELQVMGKAQRKAWLMGLTAITAPSIALWAMNKDRPEYWERPLWERNLFWLIPDGKGGFWKVPKPFEVGYLFASLPERLLDHLYQNHPELLPDALKGNTVSPYSMSQAAGQLASSTVGDLTGFMPTVATPLVENAANYDFFRQRPVVPDAYQELPTELQYSEQTSTPALAVGKATGVSPFKIDNALSGYGGTVGTYVANKLTEVARQFGLDPRGADPFPETRGMFASVKTHPEALPAPAQDVLSRADALAGVQTGITRLQETGQYSQLQPYLERHMQDLVELARVAPVAKTIRELNGLIPLIERDPSASPAEKRERIIAIREQQFKLAQLTVPTSQLPRLAAAQR